MACKLILPDPTLFAAKTNKQKQTNQGPSGKLRLYRFLVGGITNPLEKYARQIGSFPQVGVKIKLKPPPSFCPPLSIMKSYCRHFDF